MNQTDSKRFRNLLNGIARLYERELDGFAMDAYWLALRDWSFEDFEAAAGHLMRTSHFMPRPADFEALRKAAKPTAAEAWARACKTAKGDFVNGRLIPGAIQCGHVVSDISSGDPEIDAAVKGIGGYGAIALCNTGELHWLEKRFAEHYGNTQDAQAMREAVPQVAAPPPQQRLAHDAPKPADAAETGPAPAQPPKRSAETEAMIREMREKARAAREAKQVQPALAPTVPMHNQATLREMTQKLAAVGNSAEDIAKILSASLVTIAQAQAWIDEAGAAPKRAGAAQ